jgi:hypothetical protein
MARSRGSCSTRFGNGTVSTGLIAGLLFSDATLSGSFAAWADFTRASLFAHVGKKVPGLSSTLQPVRQGTQVPTPHIHFRPAIPPFSHHLGYAADGWLGMLGDLRAYEHGFPDKC